MIIAKVLGSVVAARKDAGLEGRKLLVVVAASTSGVPGGATHVAVDAVGAGAGELVLVAQGSSARLTEVTKNRPVDAVIVGIIDEIEIGSAVAFSKAAE